MQCLLSVTGKVYGRIFSERSVEVCEMEMNDCEEQGTWVSGKKKFVQIRLA